ncbi:MAG: hypothetical protein GF417_11900 [Candidatus Latescibacteria bacterium]|nr:hypothetical protein [Candidatus Latescibacterota bacterium]
MILKIITLTVCILHLLLPVGPAALWLALGLVALWALIAVSRIPLQLALRRNLLVAVFALTIVFFQLLTPVISGSYPDYRFVVITAARILLVFNIIMASLAWMGRDGFLWLLSRTAPGRLRLFLLLFARTAGIFQKLNRQIVYQLQSRFDTSGRKKYLIPRYYVQNLIAGELYSLHHYQSGVISRVHGELRLLSRHRLSARDILTAAAVMALMIAGIALRFPGS